jgi:PRTRC genetic system ThiF family protein
MSTARAGLTYVVPDEWLERPIRVLLAGVGGTGGEVLDGLARLHVGLVAVGHPHGLSVEVLDGDTVSTANIGRQRFAPCDVGQNKAATLVSRYNLFFGLAWRGLPLHLTDFDEHLNGQDIVITCVDVARVRADIGRWGRVHRYGWRTEALWLDFGNGRTTGQVVLGHLHEGTPRGLRLPNVYDLYPELGHMTGDEDGPSCSMAAALREQDLFVNKWAALGIGLLWKLLSRGALDRHGFHFDADRLTVAPLMIAPEVWAFMGYAGQEDAA